MRMNDAKIEEEEAYAIAEHIEHAIRLEERLLKLEALKVVVRDGYLVEQVGRPPSAKASAARAPSRRGRQVIRLR